MKKDKEIESSTSLGNQIFGWLEKENSTSKIIYLLTAMCLFLFVSDWFYHRHGHFHIEEIPGFFSIFGFVMFSIIIFGAKALRFFIKREENYYGAKAIDSEGTTEEKINKDE